MLAFAVPSNQDIISGGSKGGNKQLNALEKTKGHAIYMAGWTQW